MEKSVDQLIAEMDDAITNVSNKLHELEDENNSATGKVTAAETELEELKAGFEIRIERLNSLLME
jgi:predicted  nucleic acid-binding Zn-ribbon protein